MTTATIETNDVGQTDRDDERDVALPLRSDTFLGVCEAVGEDLGFNANWLRIPFAALLLWNPAVIVGCYLGLGLLVAATRRLFPVANRAKAVVSGQAATFEQTAQKERTDCEEELLAA